MPNLSQRLYAFLSSEKFDTQAHGQPSQDSIYQRLLNYLGPLTEPIDIYSCASEILFQFSQLEIIISDLDIADEVKNAYSEPIKRLASNFALIRLNGNFRLSNFKSEVNTLLFLSGQIASSGLGIYKIVETQNFVGKIAELRTSFEDVDVDKVLKSRIEKLIIGAETFFAEVNSLGPDLAWSRLAELLLILARDEPKSANVKTQKWFKKAGFLMAAMLGTLATANATWDEVDTFISNSSEVKRFLGDVFAGEKKLLEDKTNSDVE